MVRSTIGHSDSRLIELVRALAMQKKRIVFSENCLRFEEAMKKPTVMPGSLINPFPLPGNHAAAAAAAPSAAGHSSAALGRLRARSGSSEAHDHAA